jgi:hypothetical protein
LSRNDATLLSHPSTNLLHTQPEHRKDAIGLEHPSNSRQCSHKDKEHRCIELAFAQASDLGDSALAFGQGDFDQGDSAQAA